MSRSEYWPDIPDAHFEAFQRRLELVELLLDERISLREKRDAKRAFRYAHHLSERTIRRYLQLYHKNGPRGLLFYRFPKREVERIQDPDLRAKLIELVHELPSRSIPQLRRLLAADDQFASKIEQVSDRTIYRFLSEQSLGKKDRIALEVHERRSVYRSFEAPHSLALIQGDARDGIWLD